MQLPGNGNVMMGYRGKMPGQIRDALERVITSAGFVASPRLQRFLTYVVEETLAGRGPGIRGKAIAAEVYGRPMDEGEGGQNLVRVEARRLRRLLNEYYSDAGAEDGIRIHIDSGGYVPRFTQKPPSGSTEPETESDASSAQRFRGFLIAGAAGGAVLTLTLVLVLMNVAGNNRATAPGDHATRSALREYSIPRLQAVNLAEQARGMFFPVFDLKRQELALGMFRHAIELDAQLSDGYSGAAQVLAILAFLTQDPRQAEELGLEASRMASTALDLEPSDAWANASRGLVLALSGDYENGLKFARIAFDLAPNDGHVLDLVGIVGIVAQDTEIAAQASHPDRNRQGVGRFGARNIWGVSQLLLGNYGRVIEAFKGAPATGAPVSAPSLLFQAVAHDQLGEAGDARKLFAELRETWPRFPVEFVVGRMFAGRTGTRDMILDALIRHGFKSVDP